MDLLMSTSTLPFSNSTIINLFSSWIWQFRAILYGGRITSDSRPYCSYNLKEKRILCITEGFERAENYKTQKKTSPCLVYWMVFVQHMTQTDRSLEQWEPNEKWARRTEISKQTKYKDLNLNQTKTRCRNVLNNTKSCKVNTNPTFIKISFQFMFMQ